jgi:transcriptional regulator with XRE-family HTH domain
MEHAKRFRAVLFDLGLSHLEAAKLLHVSLRTLQNWLSGRHEVPYASLKLLKLLRYMELPGESWRGWSFSRGMLITPEGRSISGHEGSWWSLLVRQSRCFQAAYRRSGEFERALMELAATGQISKGPSKLDALMQPGAIKPEAAGAGAAKRLQAGRLDLSNKHFGTERDDFPGSAGSAAIETIAKSSQFVTEGVRHGSR